MGDRTTSRPETTWGAIRAVIQAGTGVAFWLEDMPTVALFLFAVAVATAVYESLAWWRALDRPRATHRAPGRLRRGPRDTPTRPATRAHGRRRAAG